MRQHSHNIEFIILIILKYTIQWFLVFSQSCTTITTNYRTFVSPQNVTIYLLAVTPHSFLPSKPLASTNLLPVSVNLFNLNISNRWNHTIYGILCLASVIQHNVFKIHPCCSMYQYFSPSQDWIISIFHCIDISHLYSFTGWWTSGLLSHCGYYE